MRIIVRHNNHLRPPFKAGSRIVKTALAVTLAYLASDILNTQTPIHAVGAVIITMQPTIYETVSTSKIRLWGTIIGLLTGSIYLLFLPTNAITMGLGIFITLTVCTRFGWFTACGISCFVFTALIIQTDASMLDGLYRLLDTGIGVAASILVNFLWPNRSFCQTLEQKLDGIKDELIRYLLANMECYVTLENKENLHYLHKNLQKSFEDAKEKYQKYENECKYRHYSYETRNEYNQLYNDLWSIFILINQIYLDVVNGQHVHTNLNSIFTECMTQLKDLHSLLDSKEHPAQQDLQLQLNYLTNLLQTDLLDIEKIGIERYELSRDEKREVANKLYLLDRIIKLIKVII